MYSRVNSINSVMADLTIKEALKLDHAGGDGSDRGQMKDEPEDRK
jgi:hypothetical protein